METKSLGYPKELRLVNSTEFDVVFRSPDKVVSRGLTVFAQFNNRSYPRLGMVIAKKRVKKAVKRNQLKRIIRESFRLQQVQLMGLDIIVVANNKTNTLSNQQVQEGLQKLWLELLKQPSRVRSA